MQRDDWSSRAASLLKAQLALSEVGYDELVRRLGALGVQETYKGVANKINRGTFSFAFFIQCMKVLGNTTVRLDGD